MTRPTSGPYFIDDAKAAICSRCERTGEVLTLAMFTTWGDSDRAMARAMVSRLDLLAALREIAKGRDRVPNNHHEHPCNTIEVMKEIAVEAIAKAEGRDSPSLTAMRTGAGRYRRALAGLAKS